jgi:hypothetical protein
LILLSEHETRAQIHGCSCAQLNHNLAPRV